MCVFWGGRGSECRLRGLLVRGGGEEGGDLEEDVCVCGGGDYQPSVSVDEEGRPHLLYCLTTVRSVV